MGQATHQPQPDKGDTNWLDYLLMHLGLRLHGHLLSLFNQMDMKDMAQAEMTRLVRL